MADVMSLDELRLWSCEALKHFCRKKGLNVRGRKDELMARVFSACEMKLPDVLSPEAELKLKASTYAMLLLTPIGRQPDPFCELDNWITEEKGKYMWPPTMYCDICTYFHTLTGDINTSVTTKALNAYKEGKAFSYFDCGWLKEVHYHPVSNQNDYCFLKAKCSPSQRIGDVAHNIWIMIQKKSGEIQSAYCTCFAGLGSTCNHVAAVLFKLDFFWRQGLTNKACTEEKCSWNRYGASSDKTVAKPTKVDDLHFRKPKFGKQARSKSDVKPRFADTQPFSFKELTSALMDACPEAVLFQGSKPISPDDVFTVEVSTSIGPSLHNLLSKCSTSEDVTAVFKNFTHDDAINIELATRGQSDNELWKQQRVDRITSSTAHDVCSRSKTLRDESSRRSQDPNPLLKRLTEIDTANYKKVPQLKYGSEMEAEARNKYKEIVSKQHQSLIIHEVGIFISKEHPQYGASPDGRVCCSCCGNGLLEIKCPLSISHTSPSVQNVPYLTQTGQTVHLSKTHKYYSQVQWEMGICQLQWCDFFVYTRHGYYLERIYFNSDYFGSLLSGCDYFYNQFVIPAILRKNSSTCSRVTQNMKACTSTSSVTTSHLLSDLNSNNCFILQQQQTSCSGSSKRRKTSKKSFEPVYLCGLCSQVCLSAEDIEETSDNSVQCDQCHKWFHFKCVSFTVCDLKQNELDWVCSLCEKTD